MASHGDRVDIFRNKVLSLHDYYGNGCVKGACCRFMVCNMTTQKYIEIKNARVNNLKGIDVSIPRGRFVVITGVSGSGKSSLAFDTLYAEGQRRYVESLNSYARQFLGRNNKPEVDYIKGIPPAIAIEQKVNTRNPRSTVGTSTEVYDYIKLLYSRVGHTFSPISGNEVKRDTVTSVTNFIASLEVGTKLAILCAVKSSRLNTLLMHGFSRIMVGDAFVRIEDYEPTKGEKSDDEVMLVIDRLTANSESDTITRLGDSLTTAFYEGYNRCVVRVFTSPTEFKDYTFSDKFEADGMEFEEPSEKLFTFNSPVGACPNCEGFGMVLGIDPDKVIPDKTKSVYEGCVAPWTGSVMGEWKNDFVRVVKKHKLPFDVHAPYCELSAKEKALLWNDVPGLPSVGSFFQWVETQQYKIQYRVLLSRYRGKTVCPECGGTRMRKEAGYVKVAGKAITELVDMSLDDLSAWFDSIELSEYDMKIAERLLTEIRTRLSLLCEVGLGYLTLGRLSSSLSGGESQRINIATSLGSSLVGSLYILDEPSIGLHSCDTERLVSVLKKLKALGNTVVVVEHDEDIIRAADEIIDIGPEAGRLGGEVVFHGDYKALRDSAHTLTTKYLTGELQIPIPMTRRVWNRSLQLKGVTENNLKNVDVEFPLNVLTVVTGVSGSGKSTLVTQVLYPSLCRQMGLSNAELIGKHASLTGDISSLVKVEYVDQNPIGKSSRSNPATYIKAYDEIRKLMAGQQQSKINGYTSAHFSFNAEGGRCEACMGEGVTRIEMQFMADVVLPCEHCGGKRFKEDILEVKYRDVNIYDILEMTINQAIEFFSEGKGVSERKIVKRLKPLQDVGLGYLKLGQSSSTLSGGESQRVKLASFLADESSAPTLFIFDEPTTGLHFHDISKLMKSFDSLISHGHSLLVIEHNMDVIKCADWVIDMGPEGGDKGGYVVASGRPEEVAKVEQSKTGRFLKDILKV